MRTMPSFMKINARPNVRGGANAANPLAEYLPLMALWLIDISLTCRWIDKPPSTSLEDTFTDDDFIKTTGLPQLRKVFPNCVSIDKGLDTEEDLLSEFDMEIDKEDLPRFLRKGSGKPKFVDEPVHKRAVMKLLKQRRKEVLAQGFDPDLPLFQNVQRLGRLLRLNDTEQAVLTFAAVLSCFPVFRAAIANNHTEISDATLGRILVALTGHDEGSVRKALRRDGMLLSSGLIEIDHDNQDLENKIMLVQELRSVMLDKLASDEDLNRRILKPASSATLTLADFPHLAPQARLIGDYLCGVQTIGARGANILFYGPPGTGKTEFAKALAAQAGLSLYEIRYADEEGDPIKGEQRLRSLNFCQRTLEGKQNVALLFDEVEDVLPGNGGGDFFGLRLGSPEPQCGKAWINRSLEDNAIPTLWITNDPNIDSAYLRRFDYSVAMRIPPRKVRARIAAEHLGTYAPTPAAIDSIAALDDLLPAQLERAARIAKISGHVSPELAWQHAEMALTASRSLLGQSKQNLSAQVHTAYRLDYLNTNANIPEILAGLKHRPQASFCFYGPPGTGKSQLGRHIADELGKPLLLKRASDLLNKYVGGTEKRIAAMFEQALDEDAVLLLDEADSFLSDRTGAQQQWEITQTNELLTQMESFTGLFIATTNLMDKLDPASLRRFSHKLKFDYLKPAQAWGLFVEQFRRMGGTDDEAGEVEAQVKRMENLTPGDFAVVAREHYLSGVGFDAVQMVEKLSAEMAAKVGGKGKVGFL
jgi:SpoVK/Ycf46/Vps4 family AAA+-type ATPase